MRYSSSNKPRINAKATISPRAYGPGVNYLYADKSPVTSVVLFRALPEQTLTNSQGKKIVAKMMDFDGKTLKLRTKGKDFSYPLSKLSEQSQSLVRSLAKGSIENRSELAKVKP